MAGVPRKPLPPGYRPPTLLDIIRGTGEGAIGSAEAALAMGAGIADAVPAGLTAAGHALMGDLDKAADAARTPGFFSGLLAPRTQYGQRMIEGLGGLGEELSNAVAPAEDAVIKAAPALAPVVLTAAAVGANLVGPSHGAKLPKPRSMQKGVLGGITARNSDVKALYVAKDMEKAGASRDEIFAATNWFKGKDGKWRYEINDAKAEISGDLKTGGIAYDQPVDMVLDHPEMRAAYPELMGKTNVRVEIDPDRPRAGEYRPGKNLITGTARNEEDLRDLLLHELNHAVQEREGFGSGGTPESAVRALESATEGGELSLLDAARRQQLIDSPVEAYRHLSGEADSRNVELRSRMSEGMRLDQPFYETFDVPEEDQIVAHGTNLLSMADGGSARAKQVAGNSAVVNIGLKVGENGSITPAQVRKALKKAGVNIEADEIRTSNTEPTLIAKLDRPLTPEEGHAVSVALQQEAIAQKVGDEGALFGPSAEKWGPFNNDFFLDPTPPRKRSRGQTVDRPQRTMFPDIYENPAKLAKEAEAWVEGESPLLGLLFNTSRKELADIATRRGTIDASLPGVTKKGAGSDAAAAVATKENARRLRNLLEAGAEHAPRLTEGMKGWYVLDPLFRRFVDELGPEEGAKAFERFNAFTGMASPGSDVMTEINRGTAADMLAAQGKFKDFERYGGVREDDRPFDFPAHMRAVKGHPYHTTAHLPAMRKYLEAGKVRMKSPKVPTYIESSLVPELGFQTTTPVGDSHWSRGVGLADTRTAQSEQTLRGSVTNPEIKVLGPWFRDEVAKPLGLEAVPAQAIQWGLLGPVTGVDTALGAPKLEIIADAIGKAALRDKITPEEALRRMIRKKGQAGSVSPKLLGLLAAGGGATALMVGGKKKAESTKKEAAKIKKKRESLLEEY